MQTRSSLFAVLGLAAPITLVALAGCDNTVESDVDTDGLAPPAALDTDGHDHTQHHDTHNHVIEGHDHDNATIKSLMAEIEAKRAEVETAFTDGDPEDAHGALHDVFHLIDDLKGAAERQGLSPVEIQNVTAAQESLHDGFEQLDAGLHDGEMSTYDAVAERITSAMGKLEVAAAVDVDAATAGIDDGVDSDVVEVESE